MTRASDTPSTPSVFAAQNLSPSFPQRAAWGTAGSLRAWQAEAIEQYFSSSSRDFLAVATPGAGKTTFALRVAVELIGMGVISKVTVVCPTEHLKGQWAEAATRVGIHIDPAFLNSQGLAGSHFDGVAVTYAQVAANPLVHAARTRAHPTLIILDEIHHGGDSLSWGEGVGIAFADATRRLSLTGTPFRSDAVPIPFVRYIPDEHGARRSQADYLYGYNDALRDGVVRPVLFMSYSGDMTWRSSAGEEMQARLGEDSTRDVMKQAWRSALDPKGQWVPAVLTAANTRLTQVRRSIPDAAGLVIAADQSHARAYARHLRVATGEKAVVVVSDDADASDRIAEFRESDARWMVAVRMVSEGVDIPRLAVGVYATNAATSLFFAQAIGRFVRARRRGETATVFIPSVHPILALAAELEVERDHVLDRGKRQDGEGDDHPWWENSPEEDELKRANQSEKASSQLLDQFESLGGQAEFDGVLFDGNAWGTQAEVGSAEEQEYLGIPGLLEPDQVETLLRSRQDQQVREQHRQMESRRERDSNAGIAEHRLRANKRKELSHLVAQWARRSGQSHGVIHSQLRTRCGGPQVAQATTQQIEARIALLRQWFVGKS